MASDKERDPGASSAEIGKYLDILAKDPNSRVFAPLAEAYRKAGLLDDAVEIALEGLKVHPNYLGGRVALGRAYFEKRQYDEASVEMQKVVRSAPDNIIAHKVLGQIALAQSDLPSAEKSFKMVLLLDPRDPEARQVIADLAGGAPVAPAPIQFRPPPVTSPSLPSLPEPISIPTPLSEVTIPIPPPPPLVHLEPPSAAAHHLEPFPLDEMEAIEDIALQADDIFGDASEPEPFEPPPERPFTYAAPVPPAAPTAPPAPAAVAPLEVFGEDESLDLAEPEDWLSGREAPTELAASVQASAVSESAADASPLVVEDAADSGNEFEVEVFSRVAWGGEGLRADAPPPAAATATAPAVAAREAAPEIEVFGRQSGGAATHTTRGEQTAFGEIDFDEQVAAPVAAEPEPSEDLAFEIFSREPGQRTPPAPPKPERGSHAGPREIEVETTAYTPDDTFTLEDVETPVLSLDEELPRIDLEQELEIGSLESDEFDVFERPAAESASPVEQSSALAAVVSVAPVEVERDPESVPEPELVPDFDPEFELEAELEAAIEEPADWQAPELFEDQDEDAAPEEEQPAAAAGRGLFDTETLASIYTNQGFYRRAAEIYQRLVAQRPDDASLRSKLEGVLALEREQAGVAPPVAPAAIAMQPPPPSAPPAVRMPALPLRTGPEQMISQLQTLLAAFMEVRPR